MRSVPRVINDRIVPHDPAWHAAFELEAQALRAVLGTSVSALHHVGSTSVQGIYAKPIIDMMGVADDLDAVDARTAAIEALGYEAMGAFGISDRRYFRRFAADGARTHHLHIFRQGSLHVTRHLAFRDYLRTHAGIAAQYSALKEKLIAQGAGWEAYLDGKEPFMSRVERDALAWAAGP